MMQWQKSGLIFRPQDHELVDGCTAYAKSPQAVEMDDRIRVYFTSQRRSADGKWISCPQFADYTKDFSRIIAVAKSPLIPAAELGQFDEHGIFPFHVMRFQDRLLAFTSGWSRRKSVAVDMAIGLAESFDGGDTFVRYGAGGPVMSSDVHEPFMIADGFVRERQGRLHMWYIFGTAWKYFEQGKEAERIYKIAHAISSDGVSWERDSRPIIPDVLEDECQALPSVLEWGGLYHMVFCYRAAQGFRSDRDKAYRLGYATSKDGLNWQRNDSALGLDRYEEGWDSQMMCYPNLFACHGEIYLLYNGNEFGKDGFGLARLVKA